MLGRGGPPRTQTQGIADPMARRTRTLREMRQEYEAAEARGLVNDDKPKRPRDDAPARDRKPRAAPQARLKVVWAVCDMGGRTVATFDYPQKADAEALAAALKARGKGNHFVRSEKVPMG